MKNENRTLIIVLVVVLVLLIFGRFGMGSFGGGMMWGYNSGFVLLGWILNILIIVLIIIGVYWLIKHLSYDGKNINYNGRKIK